MNRLAAAIIFLGVLTDARASDNLEAPVISWPASPAQLAPGKVSGTFHFTNAAYVSFSQIPEFPVDLVIEDYAYQEVFRLSLAESKYTAYSCDLSPGSYRIRYQMAGKKKDYNDEVTDSFFITRDGLRGFGQGYLEFTDVAADSAQLKPFTVFNRKIFLVAPAKKEEVSGNAVKFRWEPVHGVKRYLLTLWPIQNPDHPESGYSAELARVEATNSHLTVKLNDLNAPLYLHSGGIYGWTVCDVDDSNHTEGHGARSDGSVFLTHGGEAAVRQEKRDDYMRDEQIEAKVGISVQQPYQPSDGSPVSLQITGVGRDSAALKAGVQLGDEIHFANGKVVSTLHELHKIIAMLPKGASLKLGIETFDIAAKKMVSKDVILTSDE